MFVNEILFFIHVFLVVGFVLIAARLGKNFLIGLVVLQSVFANLFVVKQISLFGFSVTCSDCFAIGGVLGLNLLQEYYGKQESSFAVKASFFGLIFFVCMAYFHLQYIPLEQDVTQSSFETILSHTPRITLASIFVYFIVQKIDIRIFGFLQKLFQGKFLPCRIAISLVCSQFIDTCLFSYLGLYGIVESIFDVIFISFFIKCLIIFFSSFLSVFAKRQVVSVQI